MESLIDFLSQRRKQEIESFQLQILCEYVEQNVVIKQDKLLVTTKDVAQPEKILENYYLDKIKEIPDEKDQLAARKLIEEGLIFEEEERRLSLYEGQINSGFGVNKELLGVLLDTHLIRSEPSMRGGYTYELSHDTLVGPVLKAKGRRMEEENIIREKEERAQKAFELKELRKKAETERLRAEQEKQLREEAELAHRKARRRLRIAFGVSILAIALAGIALTQYVIAENAKIDAEFQTRVTQQTLEDLQKEQSAKNQLKVEQLRVEAETFAKSGDYFFAIQKLEEAKNIDSSNAEIKQLLKTYQQLQK